MSSPALNLINLSAAGLLLDHDDRQEVFGWLQIKDIAVGTMAGTTDGTVFTMAIEFACGRLALCTEGHPAWRLLIEAMPSYLPDVIRFEAWAPVLAVSPDVVLVIYTREPAGRA